MSLFVHISTPPLFFLIHFHPPKIGNNCFPSHPPAMVVLCPPPPPSRSPLEPLQSKDYLAFFSLFLLKITRKDMMKPPRSEYLGPYASHVLDGFACLGLVWFSLCEVSASAPQLWTTKYHACSVETRALDLRGFLCQWHYPLILFP